MKEAESSSVVAIVVSNKDSKAAAAGFVTVVLWAATTVENNRVAQELTYYHYHDHSQLFSHTNALLQRLQPTCIHVTSSNSSSTTKSPVKNGDQQPVDPVLKRLRVVLEESVTTTSSLLCNDNDDDPAATSPAPETMIQCHDSFKFPSDNNNSRLHSVIQQLLETETAFLQFAGDIQLQQHPEIASALLFYLHSQNLYPAVADDCLHSVQCIQQGHISSCLTLDTTAATAIHLWPPANNAQQVVTGGALQNNSIYGLFSTNCQTQAGRRLLAQWLRQPLVDINGIAQRHDAVQYFVTESSVGRDAVRQSGLRLFATTDLAKLATALSKYSTSNSTTQEENTEDQGDGGAIKNTRKALATLYDLYVVSSQKIPLLTEQLQMALPPQEEEGGPLLLQQILDNLQQVQIELSKSVELVEAVLDLEQAPREFLVQADYKEELRDILQELETVNSELDECHAAMNDTWAGISGNAKAVRLEADGDSCWQFRLPNTNDSKILQQQLADTVTVHRILKNGVYFTTKQLRQLSTKQQDLRAEYDRHQRAVVLDAVQVAATYASVLVRANSAVSHLDVLTALAHTAAYSANGYCRPVMTDSDEDGAGIELTAARHPCVELQENTDFIPNDVKLIFGESSFLLVTGPNMGGKSTYIRALGAIVTLAQIGSFVPCSAAKINICHHILARVGAGDLQERGISTFMAEMLESSSILRTATKRSLIIIDELGRGTSTFDGYGLARAISQYIVQKIGCMTVFATHFHELTVLEDQEKAVKNCHVTAQKGSQGLTFLYEIKPGPCLESFGIQVAEMANVPNVVIQDAKRRARQLENFEYRKKARTVDNTENSVVLDDHTAAEEASAGIAWINRFRRLAQDSIANESSVEKRNAVMALLKA